MATAQLTSLSTGSRSFASFKGLHPSTVSISSLSFSSLNLNRQRLVVKAATVIGPKYTAVKPMGDRVLVKVNTTMEKTEGGILLPTTAQSKAQGGEVVAVGQGKTIENNTESIVKPGSQVIYSKYAGTEIEFSGSNHMLVKEDDLVGILETDDIKNLKPLNDRVLIKVAEVEEKTQGGLYLTNPAKEKPSTGMVVAVGSGLENAEGKKPATLTPGNKVMYSKYAGNDFKGSDGDYIVLKASDVIAVLN